MVSYSVLQLKNLRKCSTGENRDAWTLWAVIYGMKTVNLGGILESMGYKDTEHGQLPPYIFDREVVDAQVPPII